MGRAGRVPRRELFPAAGQGPALRAVRARPGAGLRRTGPARGIPHLHRLVAGQAARDDDRLQAVRHPRQRELRGRVSIRHPARRDHGRGHRGGAVFPRARQSARGGPEPEADPDHRPGAADEHVLVRQKFGAQVRRLPPGSPRQRRAADAHGQRRNPLAPAQQRAANAPSSFAPRISAASACSSASAISPRIRTCSTLYQSVPSVWVEPTRPLGRRRSAPRRIEHSDEGLDNIVAFWDPKDKPRRCSLSVSATRSIGQCAKRT